MLKEDNTLRGSLTNMYTVIHVLQSTHFSGSDASAKHGIAVATTNVH